MFHKIKRKMKPNSIKSFSIYGLFGTNDVHIPFDENIKILIGENGLGKTQILDMLYYTLSMNFIRLNEYAFDKIKVEFENDIIIVNKKKLQTLLDTGNTNPFLNSIISFIGLKEVIKLRNEIAQGIISRRDFRQHYLYDKISKSKFDVDDVYDFILLNTDKIKTMFDFDKIISSVTLKRLLQNREILYFPTFRQLKEYFRWYNLEHYTTIEFEKNEIIEFGMDDVLAKFDNITKEINKLLKDGMAQLSIDLLTQIANNFQTVQQENQLVLENIDLNVLDLMLSRIDDTQFSKKDIREVVVKQDFNNPIKVYLLKKLMEIYALQKEIDNSVKIFRDICNKYLINKKVFYDESAIKIYIKSDLTDGEIKLNQLSSGEKQIISIFSKIYLSEADKRFIVLFDEPELSLSIFWQKNLLPDIVKSDKCDFMLAVTHSPFIFDNELDRYAIGLSEYFHPLNSLAV